MQKEYIFNEGENIPALVDLGVFTPDFKIVNSKYDKFKQINRFIEIVNDAFTNDTNENITILDFGCGKSYLTFIIYHYFAEIKKKNVKIIGYDLKKDVVEKDEKEIGLRRVLNFGHTVGHGIETASGLSLLHGECVALGMLPMCSQALRPRVQAILQRLNLPTFCTASPDAVQAWSSS